MHKRRLGILVGGGPAPGINSVISSVTLEAIADGFEVIGFYEGYKHLVKGETEEIIKLEADNVSRITPTGGSLLKTSRVSPARSRGYLNNVVMALKALHITHLVSIGGAANAFDTMKVSEFASKKGYSLKTVHIPKTIDNDFPLPGDITTFGFESARSFGMEIVSILSEDSQSTRRWYLSIIRGGETGHLTLGIGKSAAATLTIIPEDFDGECSLKLLVDTVVGAIFKRKTQGKTFGMAVIAEGIMNLPGPAGIEVEDILDWNSLLTKLKKPDHPAVQRVLELLNDRSRTVINDWKPGALPDLEAMKIIAEGFDKIIQSLHPRHLLENLPLRLCSQTIELLMKYREAKEREEELAPRLLRRLNGLIIRSIFTKELASCHFLGRLLPVDLLGNPILAKVDFKTLLRDEIIDRQSEFGKYYLEPEDILNWNDFLNSLRSHESSVKTRLWDLLDNETRELVSHWEPHNPFPEKSRSKLIKALNEIIDRKDFYDHDLFMRIDLTEDAKVLIRRLTDQIAPDRGIVPGEYITRNLPVKLSENRMRMFNRLLLKSIFPDEIARLPKTRIVSKEIGYELRCTPPVSSDLEYTRNLGWVAMEFLRTGGTDAIVYIMGNNSDNLPFAELFNDMQNDEEPIRRVDRNSVFYRIAREYMIALEPVDFEDPVRLKALAEAAGITPEQFRQEFYHVAG